MCQIDLSSDGKGNIGIVCKISGKPITVTNTHGMFCEDLCELEECKKAHKQLDNLLKKVIKKMNP